MIDILLVDDHDLVRMGVRRLLEEHGAATGIRVVGEAASGEEALNLVRTLHPQVVLLDLSMPGIGGIAAMQRILQTRPATRIIILTGLTEGPVPRRVLEYGAAGYLTKGCGVEEMIAAITAVARGERHLSHEIAQNLALTLVDGADASPIERLSERELSVLTLLAQGYRPGEIATMLSLSPKTVSTYKSRIFEKLGVGGTGELLQLAFRLGLVEEGRV